MAEKTAVKEKSVKQPEKPKQEVKIRQPNKIQRWWRETIGELRKVSWPTRAEALRLTKIVLAVMVIMSALLGLVDFIFSTLIRWILA